MKRRVREEPQESTEELEAEAAEVGELTKFDPDKVDLSVDGDHLLELMARKRLNACLAFQYLRPVG